MYLDSRGSSPTEGSRNTTQMRAYCYDPPELLSSSSKEPRKIDIWALGCISYELLTGHELFESNKNIWEFANDKLAKPVSVPDVYQSNEVSRLIRRMLDRDEEKRPSCSEIVSVLSTLRELRLSEKAQNGVEIKTGICASSEFQNSNNGGEAGEETNSTRNYQASRPQFDDGILFPNKRRKYSDRWMRGPFSSHESKV